MASVSMFLQANLVIVGVCCMVVFGTDQPGGNVVKREIANVGEMFNRRLKIVTLPSVPWTMVDVVNGTYKFTGYMPDLIKKLSQRLRFEYDFYPEPSGKYGSIVSGKWTGCIGSLVKNRQTNGSEGADLAAVMLTASSQRQQVVDFVVPLDTSGYGILIQKSSISEVEDPWAYDFSIYSPFTPLCWFFIVLCTACVGLALWGLNRLNPHEWRAQYLKGLAGEHAANTFSLSGSLWFVFSTLHWQGFERSPRSKGAQVLSIFWFISVTYVLVTYTAGLVNAMTWASMVHVHNSSTDQAPHTVEDLILSEQYQYTMIRGGSTWLFIKRLSRHDEVLAIRKQMQVTGTEDNLVVSLKEAEEKVRQGKFAFITESLSAKILANKQPCDLRVLPATFGKRTLGFALPKNSPMTSMMNEAILEMKETGDLEELDHKWVVERGECWNETYSDDKKDKPLMYFGAPKRVTMKTMWGAFVLLLVGIVISLVASGLEMFYYNYFDQPSTGNTLTVDVPRMTGDG